MEWRPKRASVFRPPFGRGGPLVGLTPMAFAKLPKLLRQRWKRPAAARSKNRKRPMNVRREHASRSTARQAKGRNTFVRSRNGQRRPKQARRSSTGQRNARLPFAPPEDWYDTTDATNYRIVV